MTDSNTSSETGGEVPDLSPRASASWEPDPDVVTQQVERETVLVHLHTNEIFALNKTASRGWELLASGLTRDTVIEQLESEFDAPAEQIGDEIDTLISKLVEKKLLRPSVA